MTIPAYADLELRILARGGEAYAVEMTLDSEQEYGPGALAADVLPWVPTADPKADGERLFERLFAGGKLRAAWGEIRGRCPQRRVRLRIDAEAPELHTLPRTTAWSARVRGADARIVMAKDRNRCLTFR